MVIMMDRAMTATQAREIIGEAMKQKYLSLKDYEDRQITALRHVPPERTLSVLNNVDIKLATEIARTVSL